MEEVICEPQVCVKQFGEHEKVEAVVHVDGKPLQPAPLLYVSHDVDDDVTEEKCDENKPRTRKISFG